MLTADLIDASWRKSSYSSGAGQGGDCVEVAFVGAEVAVRDSKTPAAGALLFSVEAWRALLRS
ncbi:DUF397 domain-containing protein [Amycolatopsis nigrescens]|uniref:DUF397 domain-containing protein n=1 Tax=Amycolatopsis nigrescens TaxID=381445 RepID=UPI000360FF55|nr:DUF397 domain-containing protein [Amycolatopsis nigrescens]